MVAVLTNNLKSQQVLTEKKKKHTLKVEGCVLFDGPTKDLSLGGSL